MVCFNHDKGCGWNSKYMHYEKHIKENCQHQEFKCKFERCQKMITRKTANKHEAKCEYRNMVCGFCYKK